MLFGHKNYSINFTDSNIDSAFKIDNVNITRVTETKFLGVIVDQKLYWNGHINYIALKISKSLFILRKLRRCLTKKCLLTLYYSIIFPHLHYCVATWGGAAQSSLNRLKILQKRALRTIDKSCYLSHSNSLFIKFRVLKFEDIYMFYCIIFMYKF